MKFEKFVEQPCDCRRRIQLFTARESKDGRGPAYVGSIIVCDCGRRWELREHQFDGQYWMEINDGSTRRVG